MIGSNGSNGTNRLWHVLSAGVSVDAPAQKRLRNSTQDGSDSTNSENSDFDDSDDLTHSDLSDTHKQVLQTVVFTKATLMQRWKPLSDDGHNFQVSPLVSIESSWDLTELRTMREPVQVDLAAGSLAYAVEKLSERIYGFEKRVHTLHFTAACTKLFQDPDLVNSLHPSMLSYLRTAPLFDPAVICFVYNCVTIATGHNPVVDEELLESMGLSRREIFIHWHHLSNLVDTLTDPETVFLDAMSNVRQDVQGLVNDLLLKLDVRPVAMVVSAAQEMGLDLY